MDKSICTRENCLSLIEDFKSIIKWIKDCAERTGKYSELRGEIDGIEQFKYALYFIWEKYRLGHDYEVWEEGESMLPYHFFLNEINRKVFQMCMFCIINSPLMYYRKVVSISNPEEKTVILRLILEGLQTDLSNGTVKVI